MHQHHPLVVAIADGRTTVDAVRGNSAVWRLTVRADQVPPDILVVFDGHPLDTFAKCVMTLIEGEVYFTHPNFNPNETQPPTREIKTFTSVERPAGSLVSKGVGASIWTGTNGRHTAEGGTNGAADGVFENAPAFLAV